MNTPLSRRTHLTHLTRSGLPATEQRFGELIARGIPRWRDVVRAGNVKAD